jgi:phenylpropionate dioxygenase-like ring-hydroxylating dioxygenase large terminal subunit
MIRNQWYAVLDSREVPRGRPAGVTRLGERLVFWRDSHGQVVCQRDQCAHRGAALSAGKVAHDTIRCPFHGFRYDPGGRCRLIPANGRNAPVPDQFRIHNYPACEAHGFVWVWWGDLEAATPLPSFFEDLGADFTYASFRDHWPVDYSRAIENQLDGMHLPFVHHNTIGRGERTLVDGPHVDWIGADRMRIFLDLRVDDGSLPLRPDKMAATRRSFWLDFQLPNVWENHISDDVRVTAAFAPVDGGNTVIYLRFYQKFMRLPLLRHLVTWLAMPFNAVVLRQDKRVVITQQPKKSFLRMSEKLIQGDLPIVLYRRRRQELLDGTD